MAYIFAISISLSKQNDFLRNPIGLLCQLFFLWWTWKKLCNIIYKVLHNIFSLLYSSSLIYWWRRWTIILPTTKMFFNNAAQASDAMQYRLYYIMYELYVVYVKTSGSLVYAIKTNSRPTYITYRHCNNFNKKFQLLIYYY